MAESYIDKQGVVRVLAFAPDGYWDPYGHSPAEGYVSEMRARDIAALIEAGVIPRKVLIPLPQKAIARSREPLSKNIARLLESITAFGDAEIRVSAQSWGIWSDTRIVCRIAHAMAAGRPGHVDFAAEAGPLLRERIAWAFVRPFGWTATFHRLPNRRDAQEYWRHEALSFCKLFLYTIPAYLLGRIVREWIKQSQEAWD